MYTQISATYHLSIYAFLLMCSLSLLSSSSLTAQPTTLQKTTNLRFTVQTDFSRDEDLRLNDLVVTNPRAGMIGNVRVRVQGADLIVEYDLDTRERGNYRILLNDIRRAGNAVSYIPRPEYVFGEVNTRVLPDQRRHQFKLVNPPDNSLVRELSGEIQLSLQVDLFSYAIHTGPFGVTVTCDGQPPTFPFWRKSLPHWIGLAAAGGLYYYGQTRIDDGQDIYNNDYLTQATTEAAEPFYGRANSANREGERIQQIAIGLGTTAVGTYLLRQFLHGQRKRLYRKQCINSSF